jgi:hypothetical protein
MRLGCSGAELADLGRAMGERLRDVRAISTPLPSLIEKALRRHQWLQSWNTGADDGHVDFDHGP